MALYLQFLVGEGERQKGAPEDVESQGVETAATKEEEIVGPRASFTRFSWGRLDIPPGGIYIAML